MTLDPTKILQSKREFRQRLAAKPIEEKLAMLDALRARSLTLRGSRSETQSGAIREEPPAYSAKPKQVGKDQLIVHSFLRVCGYIAGWSNEKQIYQAKKSG